MTAPVANTLTWLAQRAGVESPTVAITAYYLLALVVLPALAVTGAALLSHSSRSLWEVATRYTYSLIPLGFAMWLAHYCLHFFTSYETIVPALHRFAVDLGVPWSATPDWTLACCRPTPTWLLQLEIVFLDLGLLLSLYTAYRLAAVDAPERPLRLLAPWALLMLLLFALGIWTLFQPMQMRGTLS
jgi:hypothetical protein